MYTCTQCVLHMFTGHRCLPKLVTNVAAADGCHWDTLLSLTSSKWLFFLWALSGLMVASICLNIGHIPLEATISYLNPLWQLLVWIFQDFTFSSGRANHIWNFESLPSCGFLRPRIFLWALKGRKWGGLWSIRQRVCQLTHSDLGVSHGWAKRRDLRGPREEGGAYYLPNTAQSLSRRAFAAEKSGSYTNNNYSLSAESQRADY